MPNFEDIVTAISDEVVKSLASAGYPSLTPGLDGAAGSIRLGRQAHMEQSAPPRIIFVPMRSSFSAKDVYNQSPSATPFSASRLQQTQQRSILTERITFEVRCWGVAGGPFATDFGATQALYQQVIASTWLVCGPFTAGGISAEGGAWTDAEFGTPQHVIDGREFVFGLTFPVPVLDTLLGASASMPLAPAGTAVRSTNSMIDPTGNSGTGCTG